MSGITVNTRFDQALRALIVVLLAGMVWVNYDVFRERMVVVGDRAPNFEITTDNGRTISPKNFGGKVLVLNFWATWCPPCIDELPSLNQFQKAMKDKGVVVLGVSIDQNEKAYEQFLKRWQLSFLTARDQGKHINLEYGTTKVPETYIIDSNGQVQRKIINARDWMDPEMLRDVESLL